MFNILVAVKALFIFIPRGEENGILRPFEGVVVNREESL